VVPFTLKVPVDSSVVLPAGGLCLGVEPATNFDARGKSEDDQARDKETGERIWVVTVVDLEEPEPTVRFRRSAEVKVRVISARRPEPPPPAVPGYPPLVAFEGLTITPYVDTSRCGPGRDKCRGRLAFSLRATAMVAYTPPGRAYDTRPAA
jgi:hypothetical protein